MSDDICKHGWSRRFCEQCSQARIIASLKGPGDKGMLANPPDDLVERVAQAMWMADVEPYDPADRIPFEQAPEDAQAYCRAEARAAIAVLRPALRAEVLEEAAKVAENALFHFTQTTPSTVEVVDVRHTIAAAIRALVKHG